MNLLLLDSSELSPDNSTTSYGRRAEHICQILNAQVGNSLSAGIINGEYDDLPEQAFYMVGTIEEAIEKAKSL